MELAIVIAAIALGSFMKGVTGSGLPQLAIPAMATFVGVERAVVIMSIPGVVTNTWLLVAHWRHRGETRDLPVLLITGSVGAIAGTWLLQSLDERVLSLVLAGLVVSYITLWLVHPEFKLSESVTRYASPLAGVAAGGLQGATGISGPLVTTYLHSYRLSKEAYVFAITTIFQVFAVVQTITLVAVGLYTTERLTLSLLSLLPIMIMLPLGTYVAKRIQTRSFDVWVIAVMALSAVKLFYDALA